MKRFLLGLSVSLSWCLPLHSVSAQVQEGTVLDIRGAYIQLDEGGYVNIRIIDRKLHAFYLDEDFRIQKIPDVRLSIRFEGAAALRSQNSGTRIVFKDESGLFFSHPQHVRAPWDFWIWPVIIFPDESVVVLSRTRLRQAQGTDTFELEDDIPDGK